MVSYFPGHEPVFIELLQADEDIHCLTIELSQHRPNLARLRGRPELGLGF
jgi:hypothetical protein